VKAVIVGQGYVGLPVAMRAVEVGHRVVGLEINVGRADRLAAGVSYVEDVPDDTYGLLVNWYRFPRVHFFIDASGKCSMSPKCLKRVDNSIRTNAAKSRVKREPDKDFIA